MKKIFSLAFILFCAASLCAQDEFAISIGAAIPTGSFATKEGGAANTGFIGSMMYTHKSSLNSKVALGIMGRYMSSSLDESTFGTPPPGGTVKSTNWNAFSILAGPVFNLHISETAVFEPRFMIGYLSATSPSATLSYNGNSASIGSSTAGAFAFSIGTNLKFNMSGNSSFIIGADYATATPKFSPSVSSGSGSLSQSVEQQVSTVNITAGFSFKI